MGENTYRGRFAPLAQVPPIALLFSFSFLFTLNLNLKKILPYLYFTLPLAEVEQFEGLGK